MPPLLRALLLALGLAQPDPLPPLTDLDWFPPPEYVQQVRDFQAAHEDWLSTQCGLCRYLERDWLEYRLEFEGCKLAWWQLEWCQKQASPTDVRTWLAELREMIGAEAYHAGRMPLPVPCRRWKQLP